MRNINKKLSIFPVLVIIGLLCSPLHTANAQYFRSADYYAQKLSEWGAGPGMYLSMYGFWGNTADYANSGMSYDEVVEASTVITLDPVYVSAASYYCPTVWVNVNIGAGYPSYDSASANSGSAAPAPDAPSAGSTGNGENGKPCIQIVQISSYSGNPPQSTYRINLNSGSSGGVYAQLITTTYVFADHSVADIKFTEAIYLAPNTTYSNANTFDDLNSLGAYGLDSYERGMFSHPKVVSVSKKIVSVFIPGGTVPSTYTPGGANNITSYTVDVMKEGKRMGEFTNSVASGAFSIIGGHDLSLFNRGTGQVVSRGATWDRKDSTVKLAFLKSDGNGC